MKTTKYEGQSLGCLIVDFQELEQVCREEGLWIEDVLDDAGVSRHTINRIRKGLTIRPSSLGDLKKTVGAGNMARFTRRVDTSDSTSSNVGKPEPDLDMMSEWTDKKALTPWLSTSNGLQYQVSRWRHGHLTTPTWARVKCYDLSYLSEQTRVDLRTHLNRHPEVCRLLEPSRYIPINERTVPDPTGNYWWVFDRWIEGGTLTETIGSAPLPFVEVLRIGRELAEGLLLLHQHGIIRRELNPKFVLLREPDRSVVLTDFELAKLTMGGPTVSKDWPDDPYRAPEVGGPEKEDVDVRADVYSWGRIMTFAALGILPPLAREKKHLFNSELPNELSELLARCVALPRSDRPRTMVEVTNVLDSLS